MPWICQMHNRIFSMRNHVKNILGTNTAIVLITVAISNIIRLLSSVIITRQLDPEAFGIVGIVTTFTIMLSLVSDIGVMPFVIRHAEGDDPKLLDQVWTIRLIRGSVLTALMVGLAPLLASYSDKMHLEDVIIVWSFIFFLDGLSSMAFATALRDGGVIRLSVMDLTVAVAQVLLSIVLASVWQSYWAIVAATLLSSLLRTMLSYLLFDNSLRRIDFDKSRAIELMSFSKYIVSSSIIGVIIGQFDKIFLAKVISLQEFGFYSIAASISIVPMAVVGPYCERILFPSYASAFREAPQNLRAVYYQQKRTVSWLYMFAVGGLSGSASLVVTLLYDPRYVSVANILSVLAVGPLLALNNWAADRVLLASGRSWSTVLGNLVRLLWMAAGIGLAVSHPERSLWIIVFTVGTIEIPTTLFHWLILYRFRLLNLQDEAVSISIGVVGIICGAGISSRILHYTSLGAL